MIKFSRLKGTSAMDFLTGLEDINYRVKAFAGDDSVETSDGNDRIWAGRGSDVVFAGSGNNKIWAMRGDDRISTGSGDDVVKGGKGDDWISTGEGFDRASGGKGRDTFVTVNGGQGHVTITDFEIDDVITFCGCGATQKEQRGDDTWIVKGSDVKAVILGVSVDEIELDYASKTIAMIGSDILA